MRTMSFGCVGLVMVLGGMGCGPEDKVLQADGPMRGDGGGATGSTGAASGDASAGSNGATTTGSNAPDGGGQDREGGTTTGTTGGTASDPQCDMNGIWIGRQVTRSQASGTGQFANNWYYLEIAQEGDALRVTEHWNCGVRVQGLVDVTLSRATADALRGHNRQTGRQGTLKRNGNQCDLRFERFWSVRGASEARFVPTPRNSTQSISALTATQPLPSRTSPDGAEDWENDGELGSAWQVTGLTRGTRNTVQRDWTEWFTDADHTITPALDFTTNVVVRTTFDAEEQIFDPTAGLLASGSAVDGGASHTMTFRFLGRDKTDARFKALVKPDDFETCLAVQAALPSQSRL